MGLSVYNPSMGLLDYRAISERTGIAVTTLRQYRKLANRHRAQGDPRPGDLPEPDQVLGQTPVWEDATVEAWLAARPGRGVGGASGRARKAAQG